MAFFCASVRLLLLAEPTLTLRLRSVPLLCSATAASALSSKLTVTSGSLTVRLSASEAATSFTASVGSVTSVMPLLVPERSISAVFLSPLSVTSLSTSTFSTFTVLPDTVMSAEPSGVVVCGGVVGCVGVVGLLGFSGVTGSPFLVHWAKNVKTLPTRLSHALPSAS